MSSANGFSFDQSKNLSFGKDLIHSEPVSRRRPKSTPLQVFLHYFFTKRQLLNSSKLKEFADENFKIDENGRKFSEQVENTVVKEEIARYEQFLLFPHCFQKTCSADS